MAETADGYTSAQFRPSVPRDQGRDNGFQCDSVQGIAGMSHGERLVHGWSGLEWVSNDCGSLAFALSVLTPSHSVGP